MKPYKIMKFYLVNAESKAEAVEKMNNDPVKYLDMVKVVEVEEKSLFGQFKHQLVG